MPPLPSEPDRRMPPGTAVVAVLLAEAVIGLTLFILWRLF